MHLSQMRCTHFRGNKQKGYNRSCYECERSPITGTFCMLRYYTRFESMGCTVLFSVSISFLNSAPLRTALIMFVHVRRCRDPSPLDWRITTYFPSQFTCEGGTDQYYAPLRYMFKGEGRSTTIEHVKKQIPGGTAYCMDML